MDQDKFSNGWKISAKEPLELLQQAGGYYECPKDSWGKRIGPLVGYAGKYTAADGSQKQYVGDVYANFAKAEEWPEFYWYWADQMKFVLGPLKLDVVLGMPMGGIVAAHYMARIAKAGCRFAFAEKQVTALATETMREQSRLVLARHELKKGDRVAIGEDVTNNFSTTKQAIELVAETGAEVVAIVSWLNRSSLQVYERDGMSLPIVSLVHRPLPEYKQEDPEVSADISMGNIVLKPKNDWPRLMEAMRANRPHRIW